MDNNQISQEDIVKAASAGFAQSLINHGVDEETAAKAAAAYVHPTQGLLVKRASNMAILQSGVNNIINAIRQQGAAAQTGKA